MESAEPVVASLASARTVEAPLRARLREASIVLQADGTATGIRGLAWLTERRDDETLRRLSALQLQAMADGWSADEFARARLACLRPRRAEIAELGRAYLEGLAPGAAEAAHRMRRAGLVVQLSGEVGVEPLLGVASALGVTPDAILAPRLRFDALGAYTGCEAGPRAAGSARTRVFVGTRPSELPAAADDVFVRFTGFVAHEGPGRGESVDSFGELTRLVLGE